jgi:hypothetical protein
MTRTAAFSWESACPAHDHHPGERRLAHRPPVTGTAR